MNNKLLKSLLYVYTFVIIAISIFVSFGVVRNVERDVFADDCPAIPEFNTVMECTNSCHQGCGGNSQCVDGCYNACVNICQGGSNPATCGNHVCDAPGENTVTCAQDCLQGGGDNTGGDNTGDLLYPYDATYCLKDGQTTATTDGCLTTANIGTCTDGWRVYTCTAANACYTFTSGCPNGSTPAASAITANDLEGVKAVFDSLPQCAVAQADCINKLGIYISKVNCSGNCAIANPPVVNPNPQPPVVIPPTDNPPEEEPINVLCNDTCNNSSRICPSNLSCIPVDGVNRCRLPSNPTSPTCQPPVIVTNPNYSIDKVLEGRYEYIVGEIATFRIRIRNTGDTTLTNIKFRDVYSTTYLSFSGGSAVKSGGSSIDNIVPHLTRNSNGILEIENILSNNVLGSLVPNGYIDVVLKFVTKAPINETCNFAYIDAPDLPEINDNACLGSKNINTDI